MKSLCLVICLLVAVVCGQHQTVKLKSNVLHRRIATHCGDTLQIDVDDLQPAWPYEVRISYPAYVRLCLQLFVHLLT
jgi:hypothetical protein